LDAISRIPNISNSVSVFNISPPYIHINTHTRTNKSAVRSPYLLHKIIRVEIVRHKSLIERHSVHLSIHKISSVAFHLLLQQVSISLYQQRLIFIFIIIYIYLVCTKSFAKKCQHVLTRYHQIHNHPSS